MDRKKLSNQSAFTLLAIGIIADLAGGILPLIPFIGPFLGSFVSFVAIVGLGLWMKKFGFFFVIKKAPIAFGGLSIAELVPFFNTLPLITVNVIAALIMIKFGNDAHS